MGGPRNLSVGDVCADIVSDCVSEAYILHIPEGTEEVVKFFNVPDVACHGNLALKKWCESRAKKKLYELQIEMCEWAIPQVAKFDQQLSSERRRAVVAGIRGQIADLRESKKAVQIEGWGERQPGAEPYGARHFDRKRDDKRSEPNGLGDGMF